MKTIINKETTIIDESKDPKVTYNYGELLKLGINNPPQGGFSISEMKVRLKIWGILDTAGTKNIELEDADFNILKSRFDEFKWAQAHEDIVALSDHLDSLVK